MNNRIKNKILFTLFDNCRDKMSLSYEFNAIRSYIISFKWCNNYEQYME